MKNRLIRGRAESAAGTSNISPKRAIIHFDRHNHLTLRCENCLFQKGKNYAGELINKITLILQN